MAKIIGITGNIACGKSLVGKILQEKGYQVLDSDDVVRELYANDAKVRAEIIAEFGTLDRKQIAAQVFMNNKEADHKRQVLESIIHPAVDRELRLWVKQHKDEALLFNLVPLLFEAGLEDRYDYIVCIKTNLDLQIKRLQERNPELSLAEIKARIQSQMPQEQKCSRADYVLSNNAGLDDLRLEVDELLDTLIPSPFN